MEQLLEPSIARIYSQKRVVGAGFMADDRLANERLLLTCAHVVESAMQQGPGAPGQPQGEVSLDFPLIAPGQVIKASIALMMPKEDIAVLRFEETPPNNAKAVSLKWDDNLRGHTAQAFGFPDKRDDGVYASGVISGRTASGWFQIDSDNAIGYWVEGGFSGTPVWDDKLKGVIGMIVATEPKPGVKAAYMIPVNMLVEAWPGLSLKQKINPESNRRLGQLENLIAIELKLLNEYEIKKITESDPRELYRIELAIAREKEALEKLQAEYSDPAK